MAVARALLKGAPLARALESMRNRATLVVTHRLVRMEERTRARGRGLYRRMLEAQREVLVAL